MLYFLTKLRLNPAKIDQSVTIFLDVSLNRPKGAVLTRFLKPLSYKKIRKPRKKVDFDNFS